MAEVKEITSEDSFQSALQSLPPSALAVIYFHAPWAQPCKQMSAVLEALASTYPADNSIAFLSINAEELSDISEAYDVTAVPYLVLQRDGKTLDTVSGSDASKVRAAVEQHAGNSSRDAANSAFTLPPAQTVTKPEGEQEPAPLLNGGAPNATGSAASGGAATKNLSAYAPGESASEAAAPAAAPATTEVDKEALFKRLEQLVKAAPVMLFMKGTPSSPQCGFSRQTVALLRERSIRYGFFNILADDDVRQGLKEFSDWPTFPQLYVDGELIGGLDIVKEEFQNNEDFLLEYSVQKQEAPAA